MHLRWFPGLLGALLIVALIGVPALALRPQAETPAAPADPVAPAAQVAIEPVQEPVRLQVTGDHEDEGKGRCHGVQRAYWAVTLNPGRGEGKTQAATELANAAAERGCELSESPPEGWRGGPPPWAGPKGDDAEGRGNGRGGPRWAGDGEGPPWGPRKGGEDDGPPWGLAWGHWLEHGGEDVCARIAARMEAHPNAKVPEELREQLQDALGCDLP